MEVQTTRPVLAVRSTVQSHSPGRDFTIGRMLEATRTSTIRTTSPRVANKVLRIPSFSCSHADRYVRCNRRVNATPEYSSRSALNTVTLLVAPGGAVKSCSTAAADSPESAKRRMIASLIRSSSPAGAALATTMNKGMNAVNTWADKTMHRSNPCICRNLRTQRPMNDCLTRSTSAMTSCDCPACNHRTQLTHLCCHLSEPATPGTGSDGSDA